MRRLFLFALVLSPVVLHAQANPLTGNQAMLHASGLVPYLAAAPSDKNSTDSNVVPGDPDKIQIVITTDIEAAEGLASQQSEMSGNHGFTLGAVEVFDAPKLVSWAPIQCAESDLDMARATAKKLVISMVISDTGKPTDIKIIHSVEPIFDHQAMDALTRYRFTPATLGHQPAAAPVTVAINFPDR